MSDQENEEDLQNAQEGEGDNPEALKPPKQPMCWQRMEILAKPRRYLVWDTFQRYQDTFPAERTNRIKNLLQELFALSPREAEKYFLELKQRTDAETRRKKLKAYLKAAAKRDKRTQSKNEAYETTRKIMRKAMIWAAQQEPPAIQSIRLRHLSDIILEQICDLLDINKPQRATADKSSNLLLNISDWIAVEIEKIYFQMLLRNVNKQSGIEWAYREMVLNLPEDFGEPKFTSSRIQQQEEKQQEKPEEKQEKKKKSKESADKKEPQSVAEKESTFKPETDTDEEYTAAEQEALPEIPAKEKQPEQTQETGFISTDNVEPEVKPDTPE